MYIYRFLISSSSSSSLLLLHNSLARIGSCTYVYIRINVTYITFMSYHFIILYIVSRTIIIIRLKTFSSTHRTIKERSTWKITGKRSVDKIGIRMRSTQLGSIRRLINANTYNWVFFLAVCLMLKSHAGKVTILRIEKTAHIKLYGMEMANRLFNLDQKICYKFD